MAEQTSDKNGSRPVPAESESESEPELDSISYLRNRIAHFCRERDWDQFHHAKDLAIGISTEANELLDIFRFKTDDEIVKKFQDSNFKRRVEHELSDVLFFVLRFAQMNDVDLGRALIDKLKVNANKYPVEQAKGSNKKYNE